MSSHVCDDHLASERRLGRFVDLDEFASGMGQTKGERGTALATGERLVGGIAVHLQNAGEAAQLPGYLVGTARPEANT